MTTTRLTPGLPPHPRGRVSLNGWEDPVFSSQWTLSTGDSRQVPPRIRCVYLSFLLFIPFFPVDFSTRGTLRRVPGPSRPPFTKTPYGCVRPVPGGEGGSVVREQVQEPWPTGGEYTKGKVHRKVGRGTGSHLPRRALGLPKGPGP